jgi:hypothetical protein
MFGVRASSRNHRSLLCGDVYLIMYNTASRQFLYVQLQLAKTTIKIPKPTGWHFYNRLTMLIKTMTSESHRSSCISWQYILCAGGGMKLQTDKVLLASPWLCYDMMCRLHIQTNSSWSSPVAIFSLPHSMPASWGLTLGAGKQGKSGLLATSWTAPWVSVVADIDI